MKHGSKSAITIVELIIAISLITILGTIAYVSFTSYSVNARDSARATDVAKIVSSLHLFESNKSHFPATSSGKTITFSGAEVWTQGTFGNSTLKVMGNLSSLLIDNGTKSEYSYSRSKDKKEYEIGAIFEGSQSFNPWISPVNAEGTKIANAYIKGNYNGIVSIVSTGSQTYILALPSITSSDLSISDVAQIVDTKKLAYNGYSNLPAAYSNTKYNTNGGFNFNPGLLVVYSTSDTNNMSSEAIQIQFLLNLQQAYTGTLLTLNGGEIEKILSTNTSNQEETLLLSQSIIHYYIDRGIRIKD